MYNDAGSDYTCQWSVANPNIAAVDPDTGRVTGISPGTTTVTLSVYMDWLDDTFTKSYTLTVRRTFNLTFYYSNLYKDEHGASQAVERIQTHIDAAESFYFENFGIVLNCSAPINRTSYADECIHKGEYCGCTTLCENSVIDPADRYVSASERTVTLEQTHHCHTNIYNQLYRLPLIEDATTTASVYYLGTKTCKETTSGHYQMKNSAGICIKYLGLIGIMKLDALTHGDKKDWLPAETETTVHEIGHLFGAPDHYGSGRPTSQSLNTTYDTNIFSGNCIFGENKDDIDVMQNLVICDGCRAVINGELVLD